MSKRKRRYMSPAGFLSSLILIIVAIFALDALARLFFQPKTENIVGTGGFSMTSSGNSSVNTTNTAENPDTSEATAKTTNPNAQLLQLTTSDMANGSLILVDESHPYTGDSISANFSSIANENVKVRDTSLSIHAEIIDPLCSLFDAYAAANGWANLQIYSTTVNNTDASSIYTNTLPDRDSGYAFDIGLITSTGEVVPYIKKRNEWMVAHAWEYGFILRYPDDKTTVTGIPYAPHHFRYVGAIHAAIIHENNFCLEEYLDYLKSYTMESGGLSYTNGTSSYLIYYVPSDPSGTTSVEIPNGTSYTVSGNNQDGFIFTITSNANTIPSSTDTATDTVPVQTETTWGHN